MTLGARLLLATFVLCLTTTLVLGLGIRTAWLEAERARFEGEFDKATSELFTELGRTLSDKRELLAPSCEHDPILDSALVGLVRGDLSARALSIRLRVPELQKALGFDELSLVTDRGELLGGSLPAERGRALTAELERREATPGFRPGESPAFVVACRKKRGDRWVGLLGAARLDGYLKKAEERHSLQLELEEPSQPSAARESHAMVKRIESPVLGGQVLRATRSRVPLTEAVRSLDAQVIAMALSVLALALAVAFLLARGLARPVVEFAERARLAAREAPEPLPERGGPELVQAARAFNQTLRDLEALRERLALTERIAARREVARQIAHEIKNPLSPIRTAIETLRRLKQRGDPEFEAYFDEATRTVLGEVRRMSELVRSFSEYASLPSPRPTRFDLAELTRELVHLHEGLGARLHLSAPSGAPVFADRDQIAQVLTNLIKNALEATRETPEPILTVRVAAAEPSEPSARVWISDNGPGVPPELRSRIFEPQMTTKADGSGLGLAISQRIAVEHGGDLLLEDTDGGGASFLLRLPPEGPIAS